MENPQTSMMWKLGRARRLATTSGATSTLLHQCAYGAPWRKATVIWSSRAVRPERLCRLCRPVGNKLCVHTGLPHFALAGSGPNGDYTKIAAEYPKALCEALAQVLADSAWHCEFAARAAHHRKDEGWNRTRNAA